MLNVAICDDNPQVLEYYHSLLTECAVESGVEVKFSMYESGEQLLFMLSDCPNDVDIIYLDILMGKMDGLETAKRLREIGCMAHIIFLTTSDEYVFEAFEAEPFYYIVKDEMPVRKFKDIFQKAKDSVKLRENDFIIIASGGTKTKLKLDQILYFEVQNRIITIHTQNGMLDYYSRLEDVEQQLSGKGFVRTHRSYLVNCYYIQKLKRSSLFLTDGTEIPVSGKYTQSVQEEFSKYLLKL